MSSSLQPHGLQPTRLPCPPLLPGVYFNSCPWSRWYYLTISSSAALFSHLQFFPASESFLKSQFFAWGSQSIRESFSFSISPSSEYSGLISFRIYLTGLISLLPKRLFWVFPSTTIRKHQFFDTQAFFVVQISHLYMTIGKNHSFDYMDLCQQSYVFAF